MDGNFVLVVRMRHNQLQQFLGGSREFLEPTVKVANCNSLLMGRGLFVVFASGFPSGSQSGASSYRFAFGLVLLDFIAFGLSAFGLH